MTQSILSPDVSHSKRFEDKQEGSDAVEAV